MDQKRRKIIQAKKDIALLEGLQITTIRFSYEWHRLERMIEAKKKDIKRLEGKHAGNKTKS